MSASLRNWYTGQLVTAGEFRNGDQALEQGILNLASDAGLIGVLGGGDVVEHAGTPNFTVDVAATLARSPLGERLRSAGISVVSLAFDYLGNPTTITTPLNSKYIDVYMVFDRLPSDPRIDATNTTVYWVQDESFGFDVVQGAESNTPAPPSTLPDGVLLARVLVAFGQTQILNADIDTTVRADVFKISGTPFSIGEKTFEDALAAIVDRYNDHVTGVVDQHDAAGMSYAGSGSFANGAFLPAGTLEAAINDFVSKIGSISSTSGAHHLGSYLIPSTIGGVDITDGPLYGQLVALRNADNLEVAALTTWRAGRTNPATTVYDALDRIIVDLSDQAGGDDGIERIGAYQILDTPDSLVTGSVRTMLISLLTYVNARARLASTETITGAWTYNTAPTIGTTLRVLLTARDTTRSDSGSWRLTSPSWAVDAFGFIKQDSVLAIGSGGSYAYKDLAVPHNCVLKAVIVNVLPVTHVSLPASQPTIYVDRITIADGTVTNLAIQQDNKATAGAYNAAHTITATLGSPATVDLTLYRYVVRFEGESGTNSAVGMQVLGVSRTCTFSEYAEG